MGNDSSKRFKSRRNSLRAKTLSPADILRRKINNPQSNNGQKTSSASSTTKSTRSKILRTKLNPITDDYILLPRRELGTGISGKVILIEDRSTKEKFALKV